MNNPQAHDPNPSGVVLLQRIDDYKIRQARALRKSMTPEERKFWERVRGNKVLGLQFRRQQPIEGFIVDFYCNKARCVIEIDGGVHDGSERKKIDEHRRSVFEARGLTELRLTNQEIRDDLDGVMGRVKKIVKALVGAREAEV